MYVREYEGPGGEAFAELEAGVGLKGRRFYGLFDEGAGKYLACVQRQEQDDPPASDFERPPSRAECTRLSVCAANTRP